jgi:asparagine synthase (glutamine-hydrolysing)
VCGIAGFWGPPDPELLAAMAERLVHRGPDGEGTLERPFASLGHRRLAVIDVEGGRQPMSSPDGTLHISYNGEVYNFRELRRELKGLGFRFASASDTEVVLRAYEAWGTDCFRRFNGMWALAILDEREHRLVLSRDHLGIKPLYLAEAGGRRLFASEVKALLAVPGLEVRPDLERLAQYLRRGLHDHDERTFFEGIGQLPPGTTLLVSDAGVETERFWTPRLRAPRPLEPARFKEAFRRAVERRLVADVRVGTCLSGGLDSSAIVVTAAELLAAHVPDAASLGARLSTFSAVFDGDPIDEQAYIAPVVDASGAQPHYVRPRAEELFADLPLVVWHQDEPMVSSGPYAQYRVMGLAAGRAKVLLDGQGGDELLAGYVPYHYVYLRELVRRRRYGLALREAVAARDLLLPLVRQRLADRGRRVEVGAYLRGPLADGGPLSSRVAAADRRVADDLRERLLQDLTVYSLPSLLRYEDRNSMAYSIESRPPFLDQELVELVLGLPADEIVRGGWSRWIVREALRGDLPELVRRRRKKIGFTTPEIRWLRAERARVQGILRSPSFAARGLWDATAVARAFAACCEGRLEESPFFWRLFNVEAWLRVFVGPAPLAPRGARPAPGASLERAGDEAAVALLGPAAAAFLACSAPNAGRHVFACAPDARRVYGRAPVRTRRVEAGDDLVDALASALAEGVEEGRIPEPQDGDVLAVSEKAVAVSQGRSFPAASVRAGALARLLARFVVKTPAGIGLGIPATMQLAIEEAGVPRILLAAAAAALGRLVGVRGVFYRVAGRRVAAIDGPTAGTLPPFDTHAKLPPADPEGVARRLAEGLGARLGRRLGAAVVDANDRGVTVLGASAGVDAALVEWLFGDNPLGQGAERTPAALLRHVGDLPSGATGDPGEKLSSCSDKC